ncbi:MAG TPA: efflux RND transporter periplasmic adaptor subunit [Pseudomonadota bacterium]|nr:efflux RND transporter periplasmic adaptor subunit [Rhodanobacteraceae bacterium]MBP9154231.1 efflux RND transporter periplasmic adaptor subunit [Xanthomonadales bacterium]HQW80366.1 efflux RND transporter periplasmic adaptor subunit [Pseudomonadota bacterium]
MHLIRLAALVAAVTLVACGADPSAPRPIKPVSFATLTVAKQSATQERLWDGVVDAVHKATLSAQTGGRVTELPFDVNDYVKVGDVIVRFTDVEQQSGRRQADAALRAAQANALEARLAFERAREMIDKKLVAQAVFDQAVARNDAAKASLESARAGVRGAGEQVDYTIVRAPYSGILTERHVQVGETVRPGQPLISGLSLAQLRVEVEIPQGDLAAIREQARAAILLDDGRRIDASAVVVFPYADAKTHSFRVRLELPEAETGLQPGMTVKAAFAIGTTERLLVPSSAMVRRSEVTAVYVVDRTNHVALRQVRLGHRFGDQVEILAGLVDGERIAADPLAALAHITGHREIAE